MSTKRKSAAPEIFQIRVPNWEKYNPTNRVKRPTWFAMSNSFFDDPEFYNASMTYKLCFIYVLTLASKCNADTFQLHTKHAANTLRLRSKYVATTIQLLSTNKHIEVLGSIHVQKNALQDRTRQDKTDRQTVHNSNSVASDDSSTKNQNSKRPIQELTELWNATFADSKIPTIQLATVKAGSPRHKFLEKRLEDFPDIGWWRELFQKIQASDFLSGRTEPRPGFAWRCATFDWVMNPANLAKIAEGNYDNKTPAETPEARRKREQKEEFDRLYPDRYAEHLKETDPAKYETYMRAVGGAS